VIQPFPLGRRDQRDEILRPLVLFSAGKGVKGAGEDPVERTAEMELREGMLSMTKRCGAFARILR
jgi:hypothetical protein